MPRRAETLLDVADALAREVDALHFGAPVSHVYDPLVYARAGFRAYAERFGRGPKDVLLVGMNPGPFGMAQTGVPFGEVGLVREWLGIEAKIGKPPREHPKRPIEGFACARREVSGQRLWGWARDRFEKPERFFERFFVWNYCPLLFMEASGRNLTPDKLRVTEREPLERACDAALVRAVALLRPRLVVGVGHFAESRARAALAGAEIGRIPHPSPASPSANRDWAGQAERALAALGIGV